jgi:hypothetical protein
MVNLSVNMSLVKFSAINGFQLNLDVKCTIKYNKQT